MNAEEPGTRKTLAGLADVLAKFRVELVPLDDAHSDERDPIVRLRRGASEQTYVVHSTPTVRAGAISTLHEARATVPLLIWARRLAPQTAAALRDRGIQYLDGSGNVFLSFDDVLIEIRGRRDDRRREPVTREPAGNLFSGKRTQVVFALLAWPHLWNARVRDVAAVSGVSLGMVHNTKQLLTQAGYREHSRSEALLEHWAVAYSTNLAPRLTIREFRGEPDRLENFRIPESSGDIFVSGEVAATGLIRPSSLTLYVSEQDSHLPLLNRWRSDGPTNVQLRRKFWTDPSALGLTDVPSEHVPRRAPWPLVYADLASSRDPRLQEVAREWKDTHREAHRTK